MPRRYRHGPLLALSAALLHLVVAAGVGSLVVCVEADGSAAIELFCACAAPDDPCGDACRAPAAACATLGAPRALPCGPCHDQPLLSAPADGSVAGCAGARALPDRTAGARCVLPPAPLLGAADAAPDPSALQLGHSPSPPPRAHAVLRC